MCVCVCVASIPTSLSSLSVSLQEVRAALATLVRTFALSTIHANLGDFLLVVAPSDAEKLPSLIEEGLQTVFVDVRRDALAYVDAFDLYVSHLVFLHRV